MAREKRNGGAAKMAAGKRHEGKMAMKNKEKHGNIARKAKHQHQYVVP